MTSATDPALKPFRDAIRAKGWKITAYRLGREMGRDYHARFWAWSAAARISRDWSDRPAEPPCPYIVPVSARHWQTGFHEEVRRPKPPQCRA